MAEAGGVIVDAIDSRLSTLLKLVVLPDPRLLLSESGSVRYSVEEGERSEDVADQ